MKTPDIPDMAGDRHEPPPIGGWTSYCQLVSALLSEHFDEKDDEVADASVS